MTTQQRRRTQGECADCGAPSPEHYRCADCRATLRTGATTVIGRVRRPDLCPGVALRAGVCGLVATHGRYCRECAGVMRQWARE